MRKKVDAKNGLENYTYSVRNTLKDEKLKDKFEESEKK
jgi:L1 cell adhesion molecule like protein